MQHEDDDEPLEELEDLEEEEEEEEPGETKEEVKRRWEEHSRTTKQEVNERMAAARSKPAQAAAGSASFTFRWIAQPAHIEPTPKVREEYPKIYRAWEQLEKEDVRNMTEKVWNVVEGRDKLEEAPVYLGWLKCPEHPARKHGKHAYDDPALELGVFASRRIAKGDSVLSYVGKPISWGDPNGESKYSQSFQPGQNTYRLELDAKAFRNLGPMVNDYRDDIHNPRKPKKDNVRQPNLKPHHDFWKVGVDDGEGFGKFPLIILRAVRDINQGEELLWDYGNEYWAQFAEGDASSDDD